MTHCIESNLCYLPLMHFRFILRWGPAILLVASPALLHSAPDPAATRHPDTTLRYLEALSLSVQASPAVRLQTLRTERETKSHEQASTILPAAPELDLSYQAGRTEYPAGYFNTIPASESMRGRSYELGLRQQVDISGSRASLREEALQRKTLAEHLVRYEQLQARARVREAYLAASVHQEMAEHLGEHVQRFNRLKQAFGQGYFDRRLGGYTSSALDMGISSLKSDRMESETALRTARMELIRELALPGDPEIAVENHLVVPFATLPSDAVLREKARNGLPVVLGRDRIEMAKAAEQMASRKIFPFVELFAATGKRELGQYQSPSFQNNPAERENFWRFGIRIPLGVLGPERYGSDVAGVERQIAEEELKQFETRLDMQVKQEIAIYKGQKERFEELHRTFERSEPLLQALEAALVSRRITYFEFWGEHERLHNILIRMGESRLKAAAALGRLEILVGDELE